jgi:glucose dehydrogenase
MTAIDLHRGEHVWRVPTGAGEGDRQAPELQRVNLPLLGGDVTLAGPLLTGTVLVYPLTTGGFARRTMACGLR